MSSEVYVAGNDRVRLSDVGGEMVPEPLGAFHAVRAGGTTSYGRVRAVCGATVEVGHGWSWPVSTPGSVPNCDGCEQLTTT